MPSSALRLGGMSEPDQHVRIQLAVTDEADRRVIQVSGEIDPLTAPELDEAVRAAARDASVVAIDLSEVSFLDSSGLRVIVAAQQELEGNGVGLVISNPSDSVRRVLEISGLSQHFDVE
jgi:anti-anti-sigma factor